MISKASVRVATPGDPSASARRARLQTAATETAFLRVVTLIWTDDPPSPGSGPLKHGDINAARSRIPSA